MSENNDKEDNLIPVNFKTGEKISQLYWDSAERVKSIKLSGEWYSYPLLCKLCGNPLTIAQSDMQKGIATICFKCKKYRTYDVEPNKS